MEKCSAEDQEFVFPPSPDFHGFDQETFLPGQLVTETEGDGDVEQVLKVWRKKARGQPKGSKTKSDGIVDQSNILEKSITKGNATKIKTTL